MALKGDSHFGIGERGYSRSYFNSPLDPEEKNQADFTARSLIIARSVVDIGFYNLFHWTSGAWYKPAANSAYEGIDYGLWRTDYNITTQAQGKSVVVSRANQILAALATAVRFLSNAAPLNSIDYESTVSGLRPGSGLHCYRFNQKIASSSEREVLILWVGDAAESRSLNFAFQGVTTLTSSLGREQILQSGAQTVTVTDSPVYITTDSGVVPGCP